MGVIINFEEVSIHIKIIRICCDKTLYYILPSGAGYINENPLQHFTQLINNFSFFNYMYGKTRMFDNEPVLCTNEILSSQEFSTSSVICGYD